jgi:hypothetical protein
MKRNADLKAVKPQKLDLDRAKTTSEENMNKYLKKKMKKKHCTLILSL